MYLLLAESYLHRLDSVAIHITQSLPIRWYGLAYAAGFLIGWWIIRWFAKTGRSQLTVEMAGDLMFYLIAGVLVGGRLGHVIFYGHGKPFIEFSADFPFWELLAINRGGMSAHGGIIGVIAACWIFAHRRRISALHLFDLGSLVCTPGLFLGRLANFVNAELWGKALPVPMQADPPWWSVKYPEEILLPGFAHLAEVEMKLRTIIGGSATFYGNVIEAARDGNEQVIEVLRPLLTAYYPSQLIQAFTDGPVLFLVLTLVWLKPRKPGIVGPWFLIAYGVMRICTEVVRQPDEGVALLLGLSRGQVLSVLMILVGIIAMTICARRPVEPLGGLLKRT